MDKQEIKTIGLPVSPAAHKKPRYEGRACSGQANCLVLSYAGAFQKKHGPVLEDELK